ncbi:Guanine nucleotide-binding protein alpha-2 subunit [Tulasnella sp. 417]|nr:Guanine nucleotide-binding protein alpha-2 subunit [Tulasnella sp. 417]
MCTGIPGSGKRTVMKQIKIVLTVGYIHDERVAFRLVVYENLVDSAKDLVLAMKAIGADCVEEVNKTYAAQILEYKVGSDPSFRLPADITNAIDSFWNDPIIATVMEHSYEFSLHSASYFLPEVQRIAQKDYVPSERDVLKAKSKTNPIGVSEIRFKMGLPSIHAINVEGQSSERRKWIQCFEAVSCIIFCASLADYDQVLLEDKEKNRMTESLILFESVVNSRLFSRTSVVLLLTKIDILKAKLAKVPLERYFPEYTHGSDINKAAKYILWKFMQANRARLAIYPQ